MVAQTKIQIISETTLELVFFVVVIYILRGVIKLKKVSYLLSKLGWTNLFLFEIPDN